jgi:hypothetical protein
MRIEDVLPTILHDATWLHLAASYGDYEKDLLCGWRREKMRMTRACPRLDMIEAAGYGLLANDRYQQHCIA